MWRYTGSTQVMMVASAPSVLVRHPGRDLHHALLTSRKASKRHSWFRCYSDPSYPRYARTRQQAVVDLLLGLGYSER